MILSLTCLGENTSLSKALLYLLQERFIDAFESLAAAACFQSKKKSFRPIYKNKINSKVEFGNGSN